MATHSSTLAWRISWREEPGRLQSIGSQRVGHDRLTKHSTVPLFYVADSKCISLKFISIFPSFFWGGEKARQELGVGRIWDLSSPAPFTRSSQS